MNTVLEDLIRQRDAAEEEYLKTKSDEAWADFLDLSVRVALMEKE